MRLSRYHVASPPIIDNITGEIKRVIFSTRTSQICILPAYTWDLLESQKLEQLPENVLIDLVDLELLVPENEDELNTILNRNNAAIQDEKLLYLVIHPTSFCQLGCGYCGQEHSPHLLDDKAQDRLIERARSKLAAKKFETLEISWFGGAPLVGLM